jgi:putative ABC transport system substrate-binding protein
LIVPCCAGATEIAALFSSGIEPYAVAYEAFADRCPANYWRYDLSEPGIDPGRVVAQVVEKRPDLILALGSKAFHAVREVARTTPVVYVMVLDHQDIGAANVAGASIRVDPALEMQSIHAVFPQVRKLGVIFDEANSMHIVSAARQAASSLGVELVAEQVSEVSETIRAIRSIENDVDAWWLIPDRTTLNAESAEYLLLSSGRRGIPVIAPSRKYVDRGAQMALVPDYAAIGEAGAEIALQVMAGANPGEVGTVYATEVQVVVNARTSREMGPVLEGPWAGRLELIGR